MISLIVRGVLSRLTAAMATRGGVARILEKRKTLREMRQTRYLMSFRTISNSIILQAQIVEKLYFLNYDRFIIRFVNDFSNINQHSLTPSFPPNFGRVTTSSEYFARPSRRSGCMHNRYDCLAR